MSTGKTVGLAIIIVVICPIVLGMVWPTDTEQVDSWKTEPGIDITGDLANRTIAVYDTYTGPMNNLSIYRQTTDALQFPDPIGTTDTPNSYPVSAIESTATASSVTISDLTGTGKARYGIGSSAGFTVTGDSTLYSYGDYWPATNVLVLYDENTVPVRTVTPKLTDTITGSLTVITFEAPTEWMDLKEGLAGGTSQWVWVNGLKNRAVDMWVRMTNTPFANTIHVDSLALTRANGVITISDGTTTAELGSTYSFVRIHLEDAAATVTGLIGVDGFQDTSYTEGNSLEFSRTGPLEYVLMQGSYMQWWVKSTVSAIGSTSGIKDSSFSPEAYYGTHSWQAQIINPSTFGSSIVIAIGTDALTLDVDDARNVTITNTATGESFTEPVRGLKILSLVIDGKQQIYVNGIQALTSETPQASNIGLGGEWYTSVVVSKVTQTTETHYLWGVGTFGFDQASFCMVGLMACVCVAIAGSVWGRTTGESVLALHITMILCGAAYICMM